MSGVIGGLCCIIGAIGVGLGLGSATAFGAFMQQYQPLFIVGSLVVLGFWIRRAVAQTGSGRKGLRSAGRALGRQMATMALTYAATLALALTAGRLAGLS